MTVGQAGRAMGLPPNSLRYASPTGTVLLRWDGARQPVVWTAPPPDMDPGMHVSNSCVGTSTSLVRQRPRPSPAGPGFGVGKQTAPSRRSPACCRPRAPQSAILGSSLVTRNGFGHSLALLRRRGSCPVEMGTTCCGEPSSEHELSATNGGGRFTDVGWCQTAVKKVRRPWKRGACRWASCPSAPRSFSSTPSSGARDSLIHGCRND